MLEDPLGLVRSTIAEKYRIEECVGLGGYAAVYRATHLTWQRPVAVKVFSIASQLPSTARDALVAQLVKEASLLAELSERDATICQARDVGTLTTRDGRFFPYMVLEWLDGQPLDAVLLDERRRDVPVRTIEDVIALLTPVAQALMLAHRRGIAHRDIKPANIFIMGNPRGDFSVKLLDFGIAKVVRDVESSKDAFSQTQGNRGGYTPTYASPEQFSRTFGSTGPWTDVYALGLLVTELCSNEAPLEGDDLNQLAFASIDKSKRPTPRSRGALVSDAVEQVMLKALAVDPKERFQNVAEFWDMLGAALGRRQPSSFAATAPLSSLPQDVLENAPTYPAAQPSVRSLAPPVRGSMPPQGGGLRPSGPPSARSPLLFVAVPIALAALGAGAFFALRARGAGGAGVAAGVHVADADAGVALAAPAELVCPTDMVRVQAGKFFMGTDDREALSFEKPAHQVTLGAYCIDRTEVTVAAYKACSDVGACRRVQAGNDWDGLGDRERKIFNPLCNIGDADKANHPMNCIDWKSARAYCKAQKKRLPTEAEWEHAARGSDGRRYPWGDELPTKERQNACGIECARWSKGVGLGLHAMYDADDLYPNTAPVGSFPLGRTVYGADDMTGNVWEWVQDVYAPYGSAAEVEPKGPAKGEERVIRGGAWNGSDPGFLRPTFRNHDAPQKRAYNIGFRCVLRAAADEEG
jgi:formylglycine-generating enzyme required for sulfatase activity